MSAIRKTFDGFVALNDASFSLAWGQVHALLGENGAGKSSLMNIAAGLYVPDSGTVMIDQNEVRLTGPASAAKHGIGMVHQHFKLVKSFTVCENILLANPPKSLSDASGQMPGIALGHRAALLKMREQIQSLAIELGFDMNPDATIAQLSVAEQQRVEILKVLIGGARILILDEPTAVLTDQEAQRLLQTVRALAAKGSAVVLVTHKMQDVRRFADQVTVMRSGSTVKTLDPAVTSTDELIRLTVGEVNESIARSVSASMGAEIKVATVSTTPLESASGSTLANGYYLEVKGLRGKALDGISFGVKPGEIYGIAGVGGNGQTELMEELIGIADRDGSSGQISLNGVGDIGLFSTPKRRGLNMAVVPADRYQLALCSGLSIAENFGIGAAHTGRYGPVWKLNSAAMRGDAQRAITAFDVQGVRSIEHKAALLSGGNAQKLVLAREFSKQPAVVLAHSPSRGLDVLATAQVHERLRNARNAGAAVLLISEDLDEVLALSNRIGVMFKGKMVEEFSNEPNRQGVPSADRLKIGQAMIGVAASDSH